MGVTYKLKQEVIDLIVQKKQADPSLSCRKLVSLLQEAFQIDVSKSSINAVIKEFNLSNPVGRRPDKAPKNFIIPPERKQQLLAQVVPFLPQAAVPVAVSEEEMQPVAVHEEVKIKAQEEGLQETHIERQEEPLHLAPDITAPAPREIKEDAKEQLDWSDKHGPLLENMGFFFVRAFMQDMMRRPVLGQVLSRAAGMEEQSASLLEAVIFLKRMGVVSVGDLAGLPSQALAVMFGAEPKEIEELLGKFLGKDMSLSALSVALETELGTAFIQGDFFKCTSDAGRTFYLSADLGQLLSGPEAGRGCSLFKAIEEAVDRLVMGRKPLVFDLPQGLDMASREFLVFLDGKTNDKLDKIELWSPGSKDLWSSLLKADRKQAFIASMYPNVGLDVDFEKIGDLCSYEDPVLGQFYELEEGLYLVDQEKGLKLRAILVGKQGGEKKTVLLTNVREKDLTKIGLLENYLDNKGFIEDLLHNDGVNGIKTHDLMGNCIKNGVFIDKDRTLDTILSSVFESFETYAAQALCEGADVHDVMRKLYPLAARIRHQGTLVHIRYEVGKTFPYGPQMQTAVDRANRLSIRDYLDRRICFSLAPFADK